MGDFVFSQVFCISIIVFDVAALGDIVAAGCCAIERGAVEEFGDSEANRVSLKGRWRACREHPRRHGGVSCRGCGVLKNFCKLVQCLDVFVGHWGQWEGGVRMLQSMDEFVGCRDCGVG